MVVKNFVLRKNWAGKIYRNYRKTEILLSIL